MSMGLLPASSSQRDTRKATDALFPGYASDCFPAMRNLAGRFFRQVLSLDWPGGFFVSIYGNSETKNLRDNIR